ncbi:hypothetical protein MYX84_11325, partial [Acidobacteria bacterium AH-259-O06]|nr:hypothetical protein [Acidobacteria bacterium AH-259-O06]
MKNRDPKESKVYLDSNQIFRVFGREAETLYPQFCSTAREKNWKLLLSEVLVVEQLKGLDSGAHTANVQEELKRMEVLSQAWVCLGNMERYELNSAFKNYQSGESYKKIDPIRTSYAEVVYEALQDQELYKAISGLTLTEAILRSYEIGTLAERHKHWDKELKESKVVAEKMLAKEGSKQKARMDRNFLFRTECIVGEK